MYTLAKIYCCGINTSYGTLYVRCADMPHLRHAYLLPKLVWVDVYVLL